MFLGRFRRDYSIVVVLGNRTIVRGGFPAPYATLDNLPRPHGGAHRAPP